MNEYTTDDLNFAAVLYYFDKKLLNVEGGMRKRFIFEDGDSVQNLQMQYYRKELLCEPMGLWNSVKALKSIIYNMPQIQQSVPLQISITQEVREKEENNKKDKK